MSKKFRINKIDYVNKTFRFPKDLIDEINKVATKAGVSTNEFMIQAASFALENLELDDKDGQ